MSRFIAPILLAAALCTLQSGCCCCRLPAAMMRGGPPIVMNRPAIAVKPPPVVVDPPPQDNNPFPKDVPNKDKVNPGARDYVYNQRTGQLTLDNQVIGTGFSGTGAAKNNPALQKQKKIGPIPVGEWRVAGRRNDANTAEPILELQFFNGIKIAGRMPSEAFTIHSDNAPNAGESGIAMPRHDPD